MSLAALGSIAYRTAMSIVNSQRNRQRDRHFASEVPVTFVQPIYWPLLTDHGPILLGVLDHLLGDGAP
jgi:hypothetical protein